MALPISLPGKHLTLPHSYPSIACALVHHSLQLRPFPDYDKLPDSYYLQCTTTSNIYQIFSPELKWKKLPLKQIKFRKRKDSSWIFVKDYVDHLAQSEMCKEKQSAESEKQQMQQLEQDVQRHWMRKTETSRPRVWVLCTCIASLKLIENRILRLSQQPSAPP